MPKTKKKSGCLRPKPAAWKLLSRPRNRKRILEAKLYGLNKKLLTQTHETAERDARNIIAQAIERVASEVTAETTTTTVQIPSEEMKGRIIGKEGRNIRAFEQMMGVEILIDDSPDTVVIS